MEKPIYHLEGVVRQQADAATDFVGPLDLILHLLSKNKIEIRDIPIAGILRQYLAWVEARKRMDLEVASEFVAMASHLMYIKTRMLLSEQDEEAASEMEQLIASLEERQRQESYAQIQAVLPNLEARYALGRNLCQKPPEEATTGRLYRYAHTGEELAKAMLRMRARQGKQAPPPPWQDFREIVRREPIRWEEKPGS